MAHHKRGRKKSQRNGCHCKVWKLNGNKGSRSNWFRTRQEMRAFAAERDQ